MNPKRHAILLLACLAAASMRGVHAADDHLQERVRAAFVFNFVRFTEWPAAAFATPKDPLVVGVVGDGPIVAEIQDALRAKTFGERAIQVAAFTPDRIGACHLLYVSADAGGPADVLKRVPPGSTLTVGEAGEFVNAGGIIRLYLEDGKQRFEVNVTAAEKAKLQISSKLLKLAKVARK